MSDPSDSQLPDDSQDDMIFRVPIEVRNEQPDCLPNEPDETEQNQDPDSQQRTNCQKEQTVAGNPANMPMVAGQQEPNQKQRSQCNLNSQEEQIFAEPPVDIPGGQKKSIESQHFNCQQERTIAENLPKAPAVAEETEQNENQLSRQ